MNPASEHGFQTLPLHSRTLAARQHAIIQAQKIIGNSSVRRLLFPQDAASAIQRPHGPGSVGELDRLGDRDHGARPLQVHGIATSLQTSVRGSVRERQAIQRTIGDDHDLSSPRFSGDLRLEACFDDEARLTQGARGASVQKVQQALIDLGYDLGPTGADGDYGLMTWNAVKRFKANERLGWETMGDVGPGTMKRLNELFPPPASDVDFGDENDDQSCPSDVDIVTALEARPTSVNAPTGAGPPETSAAQTVGTGAAHISIPGAVTRFKAKVNVSGVPDALNVSQKGQFFWGR